MSKIWQATLQHVGIIHKKTMLFYPQGNGLAERANQSVLHLLRVLAHEGRPWSSSLPVVEMVINDAPTLGHYSPFYLNLGYHPVMPGDWLSTLKQEMLEEPSVIACRLVKDFEGFVDLYEDQQSKMKQQFDKKGSDVDN